MTRTVCLALALFGAGCAGNRDELERLIVANNASARALTAASQAHDAALAREARAGMALCKQADRAERVECRNNAVTFAESAAGAEEARLSGLTTMQHALGDALVAARACETAACVEQAVGDLRGRVESLYRAALEVAHAR